MKPKVSEDLFAKALIQQDFTGWPVGLHGGLAGLALYLAYYARHSGEEQYLDKAMELLQNSFARMNDEEVDYTLCNGVAGTAWTLAHLSRHEFFEAEVDEMLEDLDDSLLQLALAEIKARKYDLLHGGLGVGVYFLERLPNADAKAALKHIAKALIKVRVADGDLLSWEDTFSLQKGEGVFNLGLAHGTPSIIGFLSLCLEAGIDHPELPTVVEESVCWLLRQESPASAVACYAHAMNKGKADSSESRLAWCYGDLGVARTIWIAARACRKEDWKNRAIRVALKAARRDPAFSGVKEAGFCHGAAGIAYIFQRFFRDTQIAEFKKAADYWYGETRRFYRPDESASGFRFLMPADSEELDWQEDYTLLNGLAGLGMTFLAEKNEELLLDWDRGFLLS